MPSIIVADFLQGHRLTLSFGEDFSSVVGLETECEEGVVGVWGESSSVFWNVGRDSGGHREIDGGV